jgi:hypothetical protein
MNTEPEPQEYALNGISVADVTNEIEKIWQQMQQPGSKVSQLVDEKLIDSDELEKLKKRSANEAIIVDKGSAFVGEAAIIIAFAPVAAKVTKDVWEHFILPRLIRRFGENSITPKKGRN